MASKDRRQISVKGGGVIKLRELDPTPSDTFVDLGFIAETELQDLYTMIDSIDDAGHFIDTKEAGQKVVLKTKLKQTAKEQIDFQRLAAGKYHEVYFPVTLNNGKIQEYSLPLCRIKPGASLMFQPKERTIDIEIHALAVKADFVRTPTDYNISANQSYVMIENDTAKGAPTDTASSVATAVI